jgi:hypothetical protein
VADADLRFRHDVQRMRAEGVVGLVDRAGERVLDRHHAARCLARFDGAEQLVEGRARNEPYARAEYLLRRRVAERSRFSLDGDCNFVHRLLSQNKERPAFGGPLVTLDDSGASAIRAHRSRHGPRGGAPERTRT